MRQLKVIASLAVLLTVLYIGRVKLLVAWDSLRRPKLPAAVDLVDEAVAVAPATTSASPKKIPLELNRKVPFTTQAPGANWDADHEEFCEEAAVLMVGRYFSRQPIKSKDDVEAGLQALKARELKIFGYFKDTTAEETAKLASDQFPVTTALLKNPTIDQLKQTLANGQLVIVPTAGRQLKNPNFKSPGPLYHMVVLKGFTKDGLFITNDPGTRKGADYVYPFDRIMTAMHDWNGGDLSHGQKVVILVSQR